MSEMAPAELEAAKWFEEHRDPGRGVGHSAHARCATPWSRLRRS